MLYETAARSSEVLALDVEDLDRRNRRSKVTRKGSAVDIHPSCRPAPPGCCPGCSAAGARGPVFLTDRRARVALAAADTDPVSGRARVVVPEGRGGLQRAHQAPRASRHHRPGSARPRTRVDAHAPAQAQARLPARPRTAPTPAPCWPTRATHRSPVCPPRASRPTRSPAGKRGTRPAPAALIQSSSGLAASGSRKGRSPAAADWVNV